MDERKNGQTDIWMNGQIEKIMPPAGRNWRRQWTYLLTYRVVTSRDMLFPTGTSRTYCAITSLWHTCHCRSSRACTQLNYCHRKHEPETFWSTQSNGLTYFSRATMLQWSYNQWPPGSSVLCLMLSCFLSYLSVYIFKLLFIFYHVYRSSYFRHCKTQ